MWIDLQGTQEDSGRIILDQLPWDTIARQHGTRDMDQCRNKWCKQLAPSMVSRGVPRGRPRAAAPARCLWVLECAQGE
jgi:hypothetical protein